MSITDTERAWIEELVENVSRRTADATVDRVLVTHVSSCPHGKRLARYAAIGTGVAISAGALGSGVWQFIVAALKGLV